jgi:hypothetical protein
MAEPPNIAFNDFIPDLPPFHPSIPLAHGPCKGDGQNWPLSVAGTASAAAATPPPLQCVIMHLESAVSPIMNAALSTSPNTADLNNADDTPKKQTASKRKFPDFSGALSLDNQLFSGNKSDRWKDEQDNVFGIIAAHNILKQDAAANLDNPIKEVQEFDYLLSNIEREEGNPDDASEEVDEYECVVVTLKTNMCRS